MAAEKCFVGMCFFPLSPSDPKFFGFSEFLAGLALMVLVWTIGDVRYRFRVRTAPIPLQRLTFVVVAAIGILTLLTDLWRAEGWLVPRGQLLTPASWQAILAGLYLFTFLTWAWFAFIRPPIFGKRNTDRFARTLYRVILGGAPTELAVIADELSNSARALVRYATDPDSLANRFGSGNANEPAPKPSKVEAYANDLLLLIADKRFCRAIVESSPVTALAIFQEMSEAKKYGIQVGTFAKNIVNEALANKDSFLYHEAGGYESGLIGYHKPLSQAMFANFQMVETVGTLLDPDLSAKSRWDADQWKAYCRLVLMTFRDYTEKQFGSHSFVLFRAIGYIEHAASDLYKLDGLTNIWDNDVLSRLGVVVKFITDAVQILDKQGVRPHVPLRVREEQGSEPKTFYDYLASMIFDVICHAAGVKSPRWECWQVQRNAVWAELFNFHALNNTAGEVVKFKVRRLLYDEVADMTRFPNFQGARVLAFCLNVMGLNLHKDDHDRDSRALHKAILAWTKKNYAWLHTYNARVAEACLVDGIVYDAENRRLVRTYPAEGLRREPHCVYFEVDPAPRELDDPETRKG